MSALPLENDDLTNDADVIAQLLRELEQSPQAVRPKLVRRRALTGFGRIQAHYLLNSLGYYLR